MIFFMILNFKNNIKYIENLDINNYYFGFVIFDSQGKAMAIK